MLGGGAQTRPCGEQEGLGCGVVWVVDVARCCGRPGASTCVLFGPHTSLHADVLIILGLRKEARDHAEAGGPVQGKPVPIPGGRLAPKDLPVLKWVQRVHWAGHLPSDVRQVTRGFEAAPCVYIPYWLL